ncbi:hypothetical protein [Streptomyces sp. NPDC005549]|uniref:hypothetical protein n=1 Tax=Streptomyces sp. NPDC005549 TaxID=3154888 RepID=UPI0033A29D4F
MRDTTTDPARSAAHSTARSAVAVSAAALLGALAPKAAALEGPLVNNITIGLR